jgi:hypothetical protein
LIWCRAAVGQPPLPPTGHPLDADPPLSGY